MVGGIVFAVAMVLVVPVGVMLVGAAWSAVFGVLFPSKPDEAEAEPA